MLKVPGSIPRLLFHFLTSLLQRRKLCSKPPAEKARRETMLVMPPASSVSFFNELATEKRNYARDAPSMKASVPLFHFLTSLPQRRETMLVMPPA
jgi:hypothetical protein